MQIRLATKADLDAVMRLLDIGRQRMVATGNTQQWVQGYPQRATVEEDLRRGQCYVGEDAGRVVATFVLAEGPDRTYAHIWQGQWLHNDCPYHVIHRMAADETQRGVFAEVMAFCKERAANLRIDTHKDNAPMLHNIRKHGFAYCGVIHTNNGSERLAFQWLRTET
jgi:acetyltransferase, GNAT family